MNDHEEFIIGDTDGDITEVKPAAPKAPTAPAAQSAVTQTGQTSGQSAVTRFGQTSGQSTAAQSDQTAAAFAGSSSGTSESVRSAEIPDTTISDNASAYGTGGRLVYQNSQAEDPADQPNYDNIPTSIYGDADDDYEETAAQVTKGAKTAQMALTFSLIALGCCLGKYVIVCTPCCCLSYLLEWSAPVLAIIGLVYGIRGIVQTKAYGSVDSRAVVGTVISSLVLLIAICGFVASMAYYAFMLFSNGTTINISGDLSDLLDLLDL